MLKAKYAPFVLETNQGVVRAIKGISDLKMMGNVVDFHVNCSVGDRIRPIKTATIEQDG